MTCRLALHLPEKGLNKPDWMRRLSDPPPVTYIGRE